MEHVDRYLTETIQLLHRIDPYVVANMVGILKGARDAGGRVFCLGVGGSAATASHAVNDLRKICRIEAYAPTDNVAELTARTNDESWADVFDAYLKTSKLSANDVVWVFSVGGGSEAASACIVYAIDYARILGATVIGIVGRDGGYTSRYGQHVVVIQPDYPDRITPHTEGIAGVLLHAIISHPVLS